MIAKIRDIRLGVGKVIATVGFYFSESEEGYDECYREIMTTVEPTESGEPVGTGEWKLYPFHTLALDVTSGMKREDFKAVVLKRLRAFREAYSRVGDLQNWIGFEIEE